MKKKLFAITTFLWVSFMMNAQITITSVNYGSIGDSVIQKLDTLPVASIKPGNSGSNVLWDFTGLAANAIVINKYITPSTGVLGSSFPVSNVCLNKNNTDYLYFDKSTSGITLLGFAGKLLKTTTDYALEFSNPETVINFPSTMGSTFNDVAVFDSKFVYNGLYSGIQVDSVREKENTSITSVIDGFGTVITPTSGSQGFPCLRQKVTKVSIDSSWAKIVNPISGFHYWILVSGTTSTNISYSYISNQVLGGSLVDIQLKTDSTANTNTAISEIHWNPAVALTATTSSVADNGTSNGSATVTATGGTGSLTYLWTPGGQTTSTATGLATGDYTVTITDAINNTLTFSVFVNYSGTSTAITLTATNYYSNLPLGTSYTQNTDTLPVAAIKPGNAGVDVTWDFTALLPNMTSTNTRIDPSTGSLYSAFTSVPNAAIFHGGSDYSYFDTSSTEINSLGLVGDLLQNSTNNALVLSNPETVITFPSTYGTSFNDVAAYDNTYEYNSLYSGIQVDSVREKETITITSLIDGFGTVITPTSGAQGFPCLRQKVTKVSVDSTWAKIVNPISGFHYWINMSGTTSTNISYSYISDMILGTKVVDIQLKADSTGNSNTAISEVKWNPAPSSVGVANYTSPEITIYPNPASNFIFIKKSKNENVTAMIYDLTGREVLNAGNDSTISVMNIANGTYILKIFNKGELVKSDKIVVIH